MATSINPQVIGNECLCLHIRRAARTAARLYDEALRPTGLTNGQFSLLVMLAGNALITMGGLSEALGMDRSTLVAALKPLAEHSLVEVGVDPSDGRARIMTLTEKGRQTLQTALPLWEQAQSELTRRVGNADLDRLREDLSAISA